VLQVLCGLLQDLAVKLLDREGRIYVSLFDLEVHDPLLALVYGTMELLHLFSLIF
jgi:hypothetical protein